MIQVYGIANCDSVKKVRRWLDEHQVAYRFHDYRKLGVPEALLRQWVATSGWQTLLNRRGTTWRALDESIRAGVIDAETAINVMLANASTIRRPVVCFGKQIIVGVDTAALALLAA